MTRHPLDVVSLVAGLLFAGVGVVFLLDALDAWSADVTWVPPVVLIVLGLAGVLSTLARQPSRGMDEPVGDDAIEP